MTTNRIRRHLLHLGVLLSLGTCAGLAQAADTNDDVAAGAQRARNGGGIQVSTWQPEKPDGMNNTGMAAFLGWFEKGLDSHLAWQNTLGYWRRTSTWSESGPLGSTTHELQTHLVPTITALRVYPFTTPVNRIEPYLFGGVGVVLGLEQEQVSDGITTANSGYNMHTGLGIRTGVGVDMRANDAFGVTAGAHFESASFGQQKPGERLYKGLGFDLGLTYRFQYR